MQIMNQRKININRILNPKLNNTLIESSISKIDRICFPYDDKLSDKAIKNSWWWFATHKDNIVGFAGLGFWRKEESIGFLCRAGVIPKYQGFGIHKKLIIARIKFAKKLGMESLVTYTVSDNYKSMNSLVANQFRFFKPEIRSEGKDMMYFKLELS